MKILRSNKAYLNCVERSEVQKLWRQKLMENGFFHNPPAEVVPVQASLGRVTARSVYAKQSVPHYNGAAMDGIAVWAQDTFGAQETDPKCLTLLPPAKTFGSGCCYMVDTGDVLPDGTNAVVMIEDVHIRGNMAEIIAAAAPWQHVRIIGEDIVANEMVIPEHHEIAPVDIAALLAAGIEDVEVVQRPKVTIIPTGDELVASRGELKPGTILDVNSHMLAAAIQEWRGEAVRSAIVKDDRQAIKQAILASLQGNDMVIINAGTSAGRDDYTVDVLSELGEVFVHGVAIKPGKPVVMAVCQGKPVIGLPGYPVAAMLTAELFVRDILFARQKLPRPEAATVEASLVKQVPSTVGVEEYIRVSLGNVQGKMVAAPLSRGAGLISSLTKAQGSISIAAISSGLSAGTAVPVVLLRKGKPANTLLAVGSHDLALELLGVFLRRRMENVSLSCANVGSMGGIMAIRNNEAHLAGVHLLEADTGLYNTPYVEKFLPDGNWRLIHLAMRLQGLMVMPGNPKVITGLSDLTRDDVSFINRQRGSGTRMLLDYQLRKLGIRPEQIAGYEKEVGTHMAVAASVLAGAADAGLGVQAAAQALGLDFIPVSPEQYDLILNFTGEDERLYQIMDVLLSEEFRSEVESLGGYDLSNAGKLIAAGPNLRLNECGTRGE
ncbi:molybdenum cofactor biosynthesis proteins signature 2 [Lucifera butyrica]|uniref:Molybdopterin molybdenumtransferase n=1 Tax=Lucifera butyrica TaxID=1351585 RepID=A0A498RDN4_9FIRM|nr:molybdopterin biosynthesis protein [Lucifera butyrica]VBB09614.1 molybdenum cofactor biosynthesis proteins signature 2 [Lucifera butyrica]